MNGHEKTAGTEDSLKVLEWRKDHQKLHSRQRSMEQGQEEWKRRELRASMVVQ